MTCGGRTLLPRECPGASHCLAARSEGGVGGRGCETVTVPEPICYLDHAATTPLRPEARAAMLPWLGERFGNPSGAHRVARAARQAVDEARDAVAEATGCPPGDVIFTSGGTEADNLAIMGVFGARPGPVLCSAVEHEAVLGPVARVGGQTIPVDPEGVVDLDALDALLTPDTTLVSVMVANNEVGAVQPVAEVAERVRRRAPRATVHADAVQAAAWLPLADRLAATDLVSLSSHKVGGPQGVGALVARRGTPLRPLVAGGGQERELRSGTHDVAGIVGFAAALWAVAAARDATAAATRARRDRLADGLLAAIPGLVETGPARIDRLPGTLHVCLPGVESEAALFLLDEAGVCASAASACASGAQQASHVLAAMSVPPERARGALRLSLGWTTTDADIDRALEVVPAAVARLQGVPA
jgi:cysteine desulfurase